MNPIVYLVAIVVMLAAILISLAALAIRRYSAHNTPPAAPQHQPRPARRTTNLHYQRAKALRDAEATMIMAALQAGVDHRSLALLLRGSVRNNQRKILRARGKISLDAIERTERVRPVKTENTPFDGDEGIQRRYGDVLAALCDGIQPEQRNQTIKA